MNIFVGNLPSTITTEDLRSLFASYGTLINAIVMRDTDSGFPLGYGHVYVVPDKAAREAIQQLDNTLLETSTLRVRECIYRARQERRQSRSHWRGRDRRLTEPRRQNGTVTAD